MTQRQQTGAFLASLIAMLAVAVALQIGRDRTFAHEAVHQQVLYVSNTEVVRRASLSYNTLLADVYWIRALQHYGGERVKSDRDRRYDILYPLLDLATTLDPRFSIAYRFGAIFLAEPLPGGAGRPDLAIALLKKGVAFDQGHWDYYHDIGFIYYWNLHDYQNAADWFARGGALPGAPFWLKTYAAVMLTRGGDRQSSRAMWTQIGQNEESDWLRTLSQLRLAQLDALDQLDILQRVLTDFAMRTGRSAESWEQVAAAGLLRGVPVDPAGTPYSLDSATGRVAVKQDSPLWPLPTEPAGGPEMGAAAPSPPR